MTFSMVGRGGKVIQKFLEMFDMAMHHALINQSKVMMNSVQNAIYDMMKNSWTPGYTGPCYTT